MKLNKENFFKDFNVDEKEFDDAQMDWESLQDIFIDYSNYRLTLSPTAETIANILRKQSDAHSVRTRVKDAKHLIDKIIRKTIRKKKLYPEYRITIDNYKKEITDLIGIRVLHLYKDQAIFIDKFIRENWDLVETPTINYRDGDFTKEELKENKDFDFNEHHAGYRSWHYLITTNLTKQTLISEIQVRTIFEEGWSEIDHQLRYPNDLENGLIKEQLLVLNRIAGSADELANSIRETKIQTNKLIQQNKQSDELIQELNLKLEQVLKDNEIKEADKIELQRKIKDLERSRTSSNSLLGQLVVRKSPLDIVYNDDLSLKASASPYSIVADYGSFLTEDSLKVSSYDSVKLSADALKVKTEPITPSTIIVKNNKD
ncbi:hypothetical protein [Bacillus alkalicellulosilyticus]|uniref:hypothetical protein n=1 Tax=Alkalihalobacterium alkalicellulosilyticum TaxID=1912214 RepID=UPI001483BA24|nr:hypothetical protein [Bacillus alkalicellulosilyticus]